MSKNKDIENLLNEFSDNDRRNFQLIHKYVKCKNFSFGAFLHQITGDVYDEKKVLKAISLLISVNSSYINELDGYGYNIVQNAMCAGYGEGFITKLIFLGTNPSLKNKLDINHVDNNGDTMVHTAICVDGFKTNLLAFFKFMLVNGFDYSILNKNGENVVETMKRKNHETGKFSNEDIEEVEELFKKIEASKPERERLRKKIGKKEGSFSDRVQTMLNKLEGNEHNDYHIIKAFCDKEFISTRDLLYCLSLHLYDTKVCSHAIISLVNNGNDINYMPNNGMNSFFQNLVERGYSEKFILNLLHYVVKMKKVKVDLNYKNQKGDALVHSVIKSGLYRVEDSLGLIYELKKYGCDVNITDAEGKTFLDVMEDYGKECSDEGSYELISRPKEKDLDDERDREIRDEIIGELEVFGRVLNSKKYIVDPAIGRESELKKLMISLAQERKNPIIVGESGVGKTAVVEQLAYRIIDGEVPKFLKNKLILEISPSELVAGCKYVGQFEEKMKKVFDLAKKYDVILFIDEIHTIYGVGSTEDKNHGLESIIKNFIDKDDVKIIGATTEEEYQEFFAHDALKRRFEKIKVEEPSESVLYEIIDKVLDGYCVKSNYLFKDSAVKRKITDSLVFATCKNHRVYNDKINNPDLAISIIDKAFAIAKYNDNDCIDEECFIEAFDYCDRIYESARKSTISMLRKEVKNDEAKTAKILYVDFTKRRK